MRHVLAFSLVTVTHFMLSFAWLFIGGSIIMAAFDGKGSDAAASVAVVILKVLYFPLALLLRVQGLGTAGEYAVLTANSMIWGTAAAIVWAWWRGRRRAVSGA
jgi:hypothetical protein